jgi:hypothetical protein
MNNLSPKIKQMIMNGEIPKHLSVERIKDHGFPMCWKEQEEWFLYKKVTKTEDN